MSNDHHDQSHDNPDNGKGSSHAAKEAEDAEDHELLTHPSHQELLKKLNETEQKTNEHWDRILRMQADADNAKRRHDREIENAHKYALEKFLVELLPIIDSLEMCIANEAKEPGNMHSAVEGVQLTLNMFYNAMGKFGIKQINPLNEPFNPESEQAISVEENDEVKPGTVLAVLQKGYMLNGRLIRPALVVVSKIKENHH